MEIFRLLQQYHGAPEPNDIKLTETAQGEWQVGLSRAHYLSRRGGIRTLEPILARMWT